MIIIKFLKCLIGLHDWRCTKDGIYRSCLNCPRVEKYDKDIFQYLTYKGESSDKYS